MEPTDLRIVFRFRDLVANTLDEHRKMIASSPERFCWWGWWKRPTEDSRGAVWKQLQEAIDGPGWSVIGLFDSGSGKVWTAKVVKIVPPGDEEATLAPELPAGGRDFVPSYYRESIFSRAWMKFVEISTSPISGFFGKYAYAEPPPLPKVPRVYLNRLRGKIVVDDDELRAMDTTIWQVELAAVGADKSHFLAPGTRIIEPVSADPVKLKSNKILHLSDLHYDIRPDGSQHSWSRPHRVPLHDMIASSLGNQILSEISLIVVSGDFTFRTKREEFDQAASGINALIGATGLGVDNVVICPGNHDLAWTRNEDDVFDSQLDVEPAVPNPIATAEYKRFYERLLQHSPNGDLSMGRRYVLPNGQVLEVCSLNSNNLEQGKRYLSGMGYIGPSAFEKVRNAMNWDNPSLALRMVVLHHHLVQTENVEDPDEYNRGFGMAIDGQRLMRDAGRVGVQLAIHGHKHRAFFWRSSVYELPEQNRDSYAVGSISIIGAGSAGSTAVSDESNFFTLLEVRPTCLSATMYRSKQGGKFQALDPWIARFATIDGALTLGDWVAG